VHLEKADSSSLQTCSIKDDGDVLNNGNFTTGITGNTTVTNPYRQVGEEAGMEPPKREALVIGSGRTISVESDTMTNGSIPATMIGTVKTGGYEKLKGEDSKSSQPNRRSRTLNTSSFALHESDQSDHNKQILSSFDNKESFETRKEQNYITHRTGKFGSIQQV